MQFPNVSPEIFSFDIFGLTLSLRWYALAYIGGIVIGWRIMLAAIAQPRLWNGAPPITRAQVDDMITAVIIGIIVGGRLGYTLIYFPGYYLSHPLEILQVWQGGMSFHGGFMGVIAAVIYSARRYHAPLGSLADLLAIATPAGLLLGRIANFINAELWGRPTTLPWGVAFPGRAAQNCPSLYEFDQLCFRHPSQLYEGAVEGLLLGIVLLYLAFGRGWLRRPWSLTGVFLLGYGVARFAVEFFRQPDAQFQSVDNPLGHAVVFAPGVGLTMGQLLSLPMILLGLWLVSRRR